MNTQNASLLNNKKSTELFRSDEEIRQIFEGDAAQAQKFFVREKQKALNAYAMYMSEFIERTKQKRYRIAELAGFEASFGCKLLRGEKTNNRDHIIRLCLSAGMKISEIQIALKKHDMHPLGSVLRDQIIVGAIEDNLDFYRINNRLILAGEKPLFREKKSKEKKLY